jgi:hypothetical protein
MQAGGNYSTVGASLSYVPSTGNLYVTMTGGTPSAGVYAGMGPTTVLDQSGGSVTGSAFMGLGGAVSVYPSGDTTQMVGLGTPGASVAGGYTLPVGHVPPADVSLCVESAPPFDESDPRSYGVP